MLYWRFRKGEITSSKLVGIMLLVFGFTILLLIFVPVLNQSEVDRQICHESVILRMTLPDDFNLKSLPDLRCSTKKICVTTGFLGYGDCKEDFENGFWHEDIKVNGKGDDLGEEVNAFLAKELKDCWSMMGQGKGQIFTREMRKKNACSICSRISFDEKLKGKLGNEIYGLGDYLEEHTLPNSDKTFAKFLSNDLAEANYFDELNKLTTNEKAIVFIEVDESNWEESVLKFAGTAIGGVGGIVLLKSPTGASLGSAVGFALGWKIGSAIDGKKDFKYRSGWVLVDYNSEYLQDLDCSSFESLP